MEKILKDYGVYMFLGLIFIIEIIIMIIKRRPKTLDEFLMILHEVAANRLPGLINDVEKPGLGSFKKESVRNSAYRLVKAQLGRDLSSKELEVFNDYICYAIEMILSTPQKKGA